MPVSPDWKNIVVNQTWYDDRRARLTQEAADELARVRGFGSTTKMLEATSQGMGWDTDSQRWILPLPNIHGNIYQAKGWRNYTAAEQKQYRWITAGGSRAREIATRGEPVGRLFDMPWIIDHVGPQPDWLWFTGGEWDCLMARIGHLIATCVIYGESYKPSKNVLLNEMGGDVFCFELLMKSRGIVIVYDTDDAGDKGAVRLAQALEELVAHVRLDEQHQGWQGVRAINLRESPLWPGTNGWDFGDYVNAWRATGRVGGIKWLRAAAENTVGVGIDGIASMLGVSMPASSTSLDSVLSVTNIKTISMEALLDGGVRYSLSSGTRNQGAYHLVLMSQRGGWSYTELQDLDVGEKYCESVNPLFPNRSPFTAQEFYEQARRAYLSALSQENLADDNANTLRLAYYAPWLLYHPHRHWLVWTGLMWGDGNVHIWDIVRSLPDKIDEEAARQAEQNNKDVYKILRTWAKRCRQFARQRTLVDQYSKISLSRPTGANWDEDAYALGTPRGVIDLRTNTLLTGDVARDKYCSLTTRGTLLSRNEIDGSPELSRLRVVWQKYLDDWLPDKDTQACVQEIMGSCLVGHLDEHVWVFHSDGRSGKSSLMDACSRAIGGYSYIVNGPIITGASTDNAKSSAVAMLDGKRMVSVTEVGGKMLDAEMLKALTGETDLMGRAMRSNPEPVRNVGTYIVMTNNTIDLHGDLSEALRGRIIMVPFVRRFIDAGRVTGDRRYERLVRDGIAIERREDVKPIVRGEAIGYERMPDIVMSWMVEGWSRVRARGHIALSDAMRTTTERVWSENDWVTTYFMTSGLWAEPAGAGEGTIVYIGGLANNILDWATMNEPGVVEILGKRPAQVLAEQLKRMTGMGYTHVGKRTGVLWSGDKQVNAWKVPWIYQGI